MAFFLLMYNRQSGKLESIDEYTDMERARALRERAEKAAEARDDGDYEVALLSARSIDELPRNPCSLLPIGLGAHRVAWPDLTDSRYDTLGQITDSAVRVIPP